MYGSSFIFLHGFYIDYSCILHKCFTIRKQIYERSAGAAEQGQFRQNEKE